MGNLLLALGALVLLVPLGLIARDEITYRMQMAQASTPTPVILNPLDGPRQPLLTAPDSSTPDDVPSTDQTTHQTDGPATSAPTLSPDLDHSAPNYSIEIPRIGVAYAIGEGVDDPILAKGPGRYPQTVMPGELGTAALAGHRTIRGRPAFFYALDKLEAGDEIRIRYPDRVLSFAVEKVFLTSPYDLSVLHPTAYAALTLTTCDPPGSDEMRLIVQSRLVEETKNHR